MKLPMGRKGAALKVCFLKVALCRASFQTKCFLLARPGVLVLAREMEETVEKSRTFLSPWRFRRFVPHFAATEPKRRLALAPSVAKIDAFDRTRVGPLPMTEGKEMRCSFVILGAQRTNQRGRKISHLAVVVRPSVASLMASAAAAATTESWTSPPLSARPECAAGIGSPSAGRRQTNASSARHRLSLHSAGGEFLY